MSFYKIIISSAVIFLASSGAMAQSTFYANDATFKAIPNDGLATMPAYSIKCNSTAATAAASDCSTAFMSVGAANPTSPRYQIAPFVEQVGVAGAYADSLSGNIFNLSSWASNSGSAPVVGVFGEGIGDGVSSHSWGGNFVSYANANGATAIASEIDFGALITGGVAYGLVDVYTGTVNTSGNYLQFQSNNAVAPANGIVFNNTLHSVIQPTGTFLSSSGTITVAKGIDFSGVTFTGNAFTSNQFSVDGVGNVTGAGITHIALKNAGTKFTITGCTATATVGGATAGQFTSGTTGACTVTITMAGATGFTANNGWSCWANDLTNANVMRQYATTTTTAGITGTTTTGDVITFGCIAY